MEIAALAEGAAVQRMTLLGQVEATTTATVRSQTSGVIVSFAPRCPRGASEIGGKSMHYKKGFYSKITYLEKRCWGPIRAIQRLLKYLLSTEELSIRQGRDRNGNAIFYVRDNTTGRFHVFLSESDLRIWLDKRYYTDARSPNLDQFYYRQRWWR